MGRLILLLLFPMLLTAVPAVAGECGPDGLFEGPAALGPPPPVEVTLNLYCKDGTLHAQIFTDQGDFKTLSVVSAGSQVKLHIDTGSALASIDLAQNGNGLTGTIELAGEKGAMSLTRKSGSQGADALRPRLDLTPAQWREDLDTLARELPKRHANAFFYLKKPDFEARAAALRRKLGSMNGDEAFAGFERIAGAIGDGHTRVISPPDRRNLPIDLALFGNEMRIVAASKDYTHLLGARVIRIGGTPIKEAIRRALTLTPAQELPELRNGYVVAYLTLGLTLHGLDIIPDRDHAVYTLMDDRGRVFEADIKALTSGKHDKMISYYSADMLSQQNRDDPFWCKALPGTVYCGWHSYQDLKTKVAAMHALIGETHPAKLVIDMRDNGGGDYTVGDALLVKPLRADAYLNRKGRLYVLVGPLTFSAAMNNAAQFQDETNAILVGQTIGEKPNSFQEPRQFRLPSSHLVVRVSTRYYAFRKKGENAVRPDKEIIPTWNDVKAGRDPALDWVLAQPVN